MAVGSIRAGEREHDAGKVARGRGLLAKVKGYERRSRRVKAQRLNQMRRGE
jgi:hypothetical protein